MPWEQMWCTNVLKNKHIWADRIYTVIDSQRICSLSWKFRLIAKKYSEKKDFIGSWMGRCLSYLQILVWSIFFWDLLYSSCELERLPAFCDDCCHLSHTKKWLTKPLLNYTPQKSAGTYIPCLWTATFCFYICYLYMFKDISSVSPFLSFVLSLIATWDLRIGAVYRARSQPVWFGTTVIWPPWRFASPPPQCFSDRDILKRWARECVGSEDGEWKGFWAWGRGVVQVWGTVLARRGAGSWEPSKGNSGRVRQDAQGGGQVLRRGWIVSCLQKDKNIDLTLLIHQRVPSQWSRHLPVQLREEDRLHIEGIGASKDKGKRGGDGRVVC